MRATCGGCRGSARSKGGRGVGGSPSEVIDDGAVLGTVWVEVGHSGKCGDSADAEGAGDKGGWGSWRGV
jgi:hypothetical protein